MSMIGNYKCIQTDKLQEILNHLRYGDDINALGKYLYPDLYTDERTFDPKDPELDIGKSWHGVHYLLNGRKWEGEPPLLNVVLGGKEIGSDLGYGPARYLTVVQVRAVADALSQLDRDELRTRFRPSEFDAVGIYPQGWSEEHAAEDFDFLWEKLVAVQDFFRQAVHYGDAMLLYLN